MKRMDAKTLAELARTNGLELIDLEVLAMLPPETNCDERRGGAVLGEIARDLGQRTTVITAAYSRIRRRSRRAWGVADPLVYWHRPDTVVNERVTVSLARPVWEWARKFL